MIDVLRIISAPLVAFYFLAIKFRNYLFDKGIFKTERVNAKVISVGNITVGGSGKTPAVLYLAELMKRNGIRAGILSRGYRRKTSGYLLVSDGKKIYSTVDDCGDEMYFVSTETSLPTAVSENRVDGCKRMLEETDIEAIILDDAFQHRWIHRDIDIVIIDQRFLNKTGNKEQRLLPLGNMREPFDSLKRADLIILNRKFLDDYSLPESLKHHFENKPVFRAYYEVEGIYDVKTHKKYSFEDFKGQKSLIVCGVAKPHSFLNVLEKNEIDFTNKMLFPDHKNYTLKEVQAIRKQFYDTNAYSVLTTQKDAVKLTKYSKELDDIDIFYLKISLKIEDSEKFDDMIISKIKYNPTHKN
ncbi:tetraacyldisaccharide 4'-kinase [Melioribacter roseus P3M-2]|uniref:Tetraacyldisaccharide 4'-kinase n=1 Tax=Melioribacter roseus (strain DSM 23840 / JCM 17771 / VKM B-2668 / P3M-2) TaxID=1191523 RepID=I6ZSQ8_MELRP|nr:tetraacyldisaccharide 4'-kinase [Melioribacter roseus]AFN75069.1 tetraacyldisaccharide 4'-kinase [Melioribacter roseus P3M-2]